MLYVKTRRLSHSSALVTIFLTDIVLSNVFNPTHKSLEFKHASQQHGKHKYMKEDEDRCMPVVESIRMMPQIHLL